MLRGMPATRRLLDRYPAATSWTDETTVIGPGFVLDGEIETPGCVVVSGRVDGPIRAGELVLVRLGAVVRGPLDAESVLIEGAVEGDVEVADQFELGVSGRLRGDVSGPRIAVAEGAYLKGRVRASAGGIKKFRERRHG
jgi:cytoskeletal protein CcmA (bactofilin family)